MKFWTFALTLTLNTAEQRTVSQHTPAYDDDDDDNNGIFLSTCAAALSAEQT